MRVLPAALWGNGGNGAFKNFQQSLLNTLARYIACNGRVFALAGNFIDLIDVYNALLCALNIIVAGLQKLEQNVFNILADITRFRECGCIRNGKRNVKHLCKRFRKQGFAAAGRSEHDDIALAEFGIRLCFLGINAFVVVIYRNSKCALCMILADNVIVEGFYDVNGFRQFVRSFRRIRIGKGRLLFKNFPAELNAFVANVNARAGKDTIYLIAAFSAKRAFDCIVVTVFCHSD